MAVKWLSWDLNPNSATIYMLITVNTHEHILLCVHTHIHVLVECGLGEKGFQ